MVRFEWDARKALSNRKKHGISFDEAQSVFFDEFALQFFDEEHSAEGEDRFVMLGLSHHSRILVVCHCEREEGNVIRIISARRATSKERKHYQGPAS